MKVCIKCLIEKDFSSYSVGRNVCKKCRIDSRKSKVIGLIDKTCSVCKKIKTVDNFDKSYSGKGGYDNRCKPCKKMNKKKYKISTNKISKKCSTCGMEKKLEYFYNNININDGKHALCIECHKAYRTNYKPKRSELKRYRTKVDPSFRLRCNTASAINHYLRGQSKSNKSLNLLGVDNIGQYRVFLESQFGENYSWDNYGKEWHIDHIIPINIFDLSNPEHQIIAFSHLNTRPLPIRENLSRSKDSFSLNDLKVVIDRGLTLPIEILDKLKTTQ